MRDNSRFQKELPDGLERLLDRLLGEDRQDFIELIGSSLPATFRFNPLKHSIDFQTTLLKQQGFSFRSLAELRDSWQVDRAPCPIGKSFSHFTGHLYVQDLSSMLPPLVLEPRPGERVLDMCASPGSKATQIAALMENKGLLLANDGSRRRTRNLISNLRRFGILNTAVSSCPGEQLGNLYFEKFDRVLLDPPCSALGTLHKSPSVLGWWTPERSKKLAVIQKNLLHSGLKALKPGGVLVYSTCTIAPEENERVIQFALDHFPVDLELIRVAGLRTRCGLTSEGRERFHPAMERCVRLYPVDNLSEGFFLARLRKRAAFGESRRPEPTPTGLSFGRIESPSELSETMVQVLNYFGIDEELFHNLSLVNGGQVVLGCSRELSRFPLTRQVFTAGLPVARIDGPLGLTTEGVQWCGHLASRNCVDLYAFDELGSFLNREAIQIAGGNRHQLVVRYQGMGIGHGFVTEARLISRFPRTGIRFSFANGGS